MEQLTTKPLGNINYYSQLLAFIGIALILWAVFSFLGIAISPALFTVSLSQIGNFLAHLDNPAVLNSLKLLQILNAIGLFIVPPILFAYLVSEHPGSYLSLREKPLATSLFYTVITMFAALPLINYMGEINSHLQLPEFMSEIQNWMKEKEDQAAVITKAFLHFSGFGEFMINFIMIALLPALGEELVFRGVLQKLFFKMFKNIHVAIIITSILFSAFHLQFFGFLPRMVLGLFFGYLLYWSGSLWLPITAHFVNNGAAVIFAYIYQNKLTDLDPDKVGVEGNILPAVGFAVVAVSFFIVRIYKTEKKRNRIIPE